MAKTQKYGLSEDVVTWLGRGRGVGEAERSAHGMGGELGAATSISDMPWGFGQLFLVPEVCSRLLYSERPLSHPNIATSSLKFLYQSSLALSLLEVTGSHDYPQRLSSISRKHHSFPLEMSTFMAF